ncbi:MAG: hypothetical protein R3199_04190 [Gemmatimonadota bacterium]|nr:hypothetical protein [Gemmatimonadota bacterium]
MIPAPNLHARGSSRLAVLSAGAALAVSALACGPGGGPAGELLVLHTASAYGYFEDCGCRYDSTGGLAKRAWVIDSLQRASDVPTLLVDAGDFSGGDNVYGAELGRVMVEAMDVIGYDAMTFGEWDLNQGTAYLREVVTGSSIAWVHTNYDVAGLEDLGHETLVVEKGGRRIGLIGLFNPTILLDAAMRDSVSVDRDVAASATRAVADLEERGVDAIVVLSHLSYQADRVLAREVEGIDLIVSGHGGKSLVGAEEARADTWIVAPGDLGRFLGRALLSFEATDGEAADVAAVDAELIVMEPGLPDDPRIEPLLERYEERRKTMVESELGE